MVATRRLVTFAFRDAADMPARGVVVRITPAIPFTVVGTVEGDIRIVARPVSAVTADDGTGQVWLYPSTDPGIVPSGWTYNVVVTDPNRSMDAFSVQVPSGVMPVDLMALPRVGAWTGTNTPTPNTTGDSVTVITPTPTPVTGPYPTTPIIGGAGSSVGFILGTSLLGTAYLGAST